MFDISPIQILIVLAIALLIFGPKRLPELGRSFGRGVRDFKSGITGEDDTRPTAAPTTHGAEKDQPSAEQLIAQAATPDTAADELEAAKKTSAGAR